MEEKSQLWFAIYSSFFLVQARRRKGKEEKKKKRNQGMKPICMDTCLGLCIEAITNPTCLWVY